MGQSHKKWDNLAKSGTVPLFVGQSHKKWDSLIVIRITISFSIGLLNYRVAEVSIRALHILSKSVVSLLEFVVLFVGQSHF